MGARKPPEPVKLFCGIIYREEKDYKKARDILEGHFSRIELETQRIGFNYTDYYKDEMGEPLFRRFVSFAKKVDPGELCRAKVITNSIEKRFRDKNKRRVNIDPGYICLAKLVLATTKDFAHRIYLGRGIFAETTLLYRGNSFRYLEWTYPDYRTAEYIDIFNNIRNNYASETVVHRSV